MRAEFLGEAERVDWLKDLDELSHIADSAMGLVREEVESLAGEPLALDRLIRNIARELTDLGFKISSTAIEEARIAGAPLALSRAFRNFMINAATHGEGATIGLRVRRSTAQILIEDNGPGIPEELLERVFEPFFRVDAARRQSVPGAGLGLAIAKEIIDRQKGTITITNRVEGGLRQEITFSALASAG